MVRLKPWQWVVLAMPIASIMIFLLVSAGMQIHTWGISWIWAVFTLVFVAWRWLLVKWTQPAIRQIEAALAEVKEELKSAVEDTTPSVSSDKTQQIEAALQEILTIAQGDRPIWEDWTTFWQRCQDLVRAIALIYYPQVQYPLLNIYVPQAYGLIRGTVDDLDQWMQKLSPALNQVTIGQAYQAYEVYRKLEPSARKVWRAWNWAQWLLNPVAAAANRATKGTTNQANQQLLVNLGQLLREAALNNLCRQAIALYSGTTVNISTATISTPTLPKTKTQTLENILAQAQPVEKVAQKPVNILLAGRTGAGKSSLINTIFQSNLAEVDVLPSTAEIQNYHWQTQDGETLNLLDTPGYEQVKRGDLRDLVLEYATKADLLLLVTPVLDPALQMDVDFLQEIKTTVADIPAIAVVTQVDRLRPIREWQPPYDWELGNRPKEIAIREATEYRAKLLGDFCNLVIPVVTGDTKTGRLAWGIEALSLGLIQAIAPAKQLRLARFLRNLEARTVAAAKIIDHYTLQMATTQGLTALLKSPVLQFISTISTGSPTLAYLLAEQIPVEQLPIVIGKLQMAYDLFSLLKTEESSTLNFDLLSLWPLLLENPTTPDRNAWAFGHAVVEYWTQNLTVEQLRQRFDYYLQQV
ncbi:Small GTP-binding protein domain protein [Trichormus variabilis ATCC 29413]|uniref:Small GTP-binding protein domain protein n=2 Tax=Anabaena variabilis TaxID=264691 RepID=Q3MBC5_TRIV2|nr:MULTISPECIES: GTPase family protein [Nostocaceae]ABA21711.1 Small GTP-binding protein domain protein [Trichormus variabilis ATCC 29413]MBC1213060.1 GTPase family protein [Trichormus variabilis ARAD]MBC1257830.1 GTPase family protein [Trichormus variabilis V5]MBC1266533.1 GTPase family protein [Trichormus variabilis FSR]MBC1303157.1 GTPase family protein [Trichormus variabilis N2B]